MAIPKRRIAIFRGGDRCARPIQLPLPSTAGQVITADADLEPIWAAPSGGGGSVASVAVENPSGAILSVTVDGINDTLDLTAIVQAAETNDVSADAGNLLVLGTDDLPKLIAGAVTGLATVDVKDLSGNHLCYAFP